MCGIVGFIDPNKDALNQLKNMMNKIAHRGPDGQGHFIDDTIALGHVRLSIIDHSGGQQPMFYKNYVLIFNGEIYNYKELKKTLIDHHYTFDTESDTEVLIKGFDFYQKEIVHYLRGMFSFVIYNKEDHSLFCARDQFGIKPFYYYNHNNTFLFSSEPKAFFEHPSFIKEFNDDVLGEYLHFNFVPFENTMFKYVYCLLPGHTLTYKNNTLQINRYFQIEFNKDASLSHPVTDISHIMKDSIEHHLLSDVPIGSFLSSGIDSSYIVSLAKTDETFTASYTNEKYDELPYAKELSQYFDIENKQKTITKEDYFNVLKDAIYHLDEPLSDPSAISLYLISQLASEDIKVILSGEGADELFGGYNVYHIEKEHKFYRCLPHFLRRWIGLFFKRFPSLKGSEFFMRNGLNVEEYYLTASPVFSLKEINTLLKVNHHLSYENLYAKLDLSHMSNIQKKQYIDLNLWFVKDILLKGDKMTMAHSIESRVPFTDIDVYQVARELSDDQKINNETTKVSLREAAKEVIPTKAYQKKKLGFPVPIREWMKEEDIYQDMKTQFQSDFVNHYFNSQLLMKWLDEHKDNKHDHYKKLWCIYCLSLWYDIFFNEKK